MWISCRVMRVIVSSYILSPFLLFVSIRPDFVKACLFRVIEFLGIICPYFLMWLKLKIQRCEYYGYKIIILATDPNLRKVMVLSTSPCYIIHPHLYNTSRTIWPCFVLNSLKAKGPSIKWSPVLPEGECAGLKVNTKYKTINWSQSLFLSVVQRHKRAWFLINSVCIQLPIVRVMTKA